jgi:hypothetical protein
LRYWQDLGVHLALERLPTFSLVGVTVTTTADAAEADRWMATHVYAPARAPAAEGPALARPLRVERLGFDTEWCHRAGVGFAVAVVQLATLQACLVACIRRAAPLPPLVAAALADPRLEKVGVALEQDVEYVQAQFGVTCAAVNDLSVAALALGFGEGAGTKHVGTHRPGWAGRIAHLYGVAQAHGGSAAGGEPAQEQRAGGAYLEAGVPVCVSVLVCFRVCGWVADGVGRWGRCRIGAWCRSRAHRSSMQRRTRWWPPSWPRPCAHGAAPFDRVRA